VAALLVIKPGLQTTIQDRGRWGFQWLGVPVAGPMDPCSHRLANALVGNDADAAALEITLVGPEVEFEDERVVAVAGAEFVLTLDGRVEGGNTAIVAPASRTSFGPFAKSSRPSAYLARPARAPIGSLSRARTLREHLRLGAGGGRAGEPSLEHLRIVASVNPGLPLVGAADPARWLSRNDH